MTFDIGAAPCNTAPGLPIKRSGVFRVRLPFGRSALKCKRKGNIKNIGAFVRVFRALKGSSFMVS